MLMQTCWYHCLHVSPVLISIVSSNEDELTFHNFAPWHFKCTMILSSKATSTPISVQFIIRIIGVLILSSLLNSNIVILTYKDNKTAKSTNPALYIIPIEIAQNRKAKPMRLFIAVWNPTIERAPIIPNEMTMENWITIIIPVVIKATYISETVLMTRLFFINRYANISCITYIWNSIIFNDNRWVHMTFPYKKLFFEVKDVNQTGWEATQ